MNELREKLDASRKDCEKLNEQMAAKVSNHLQLIIRWSFLIQSRTVFVPETVLNLND